MRGSQRRRSGGLCTALAVAGWLGSCPAWAVSGPGSVEMLEGRLQAMSDDEDQLPTATELRQIESGFINLLDHQPEDPRLLADLARFYGHWGEALQTASPAALRLVTGAADPIRLAWRLHCGAGELGADLLFAALTVKPEVPDIWLEAANNVGNPAWKIVATEEGARLLARRDEPELQRLAAVAVESALKLDIAYGQLHRASAMIAALPAAVRAEVESGTQGNVKAEIGHADIEGDLEDLRLDLVLLSVARGDMVAADRFLAAVRPGAPVSPQSGGDRASAEGQDRSGDEDSPQAANGDAQVQPESAWYRLLEAWRLSPDDPFDVLTALVEAGGIGEGRNLAPAAVARQGGYPGLEARFIGSALSRLTDLTPPASERKLAPPGIAAAAAALEAEIGGLRSRLEERLNRSIDEARAALGPDPTAPVVDRLLRSPLLVSFPELPLPAGVVPLSAEAIALRSSAAEAQVRLPAELAERFQVVRTERSGRRAVVIASSLDYGSGYWVILSSDGGTTWSQPYFAGVELGRNYTVREASDLPLLAGDHLHVEVERQDAEPAADSSAASDAPPEGRPGRIVQGIYLDIPLATLERDSDGDGLTDLAEERLVTDPADPDTDHDGVPDGVDTLPQVASEKAPSPESRAFAALFTAMRWDERFGGRPAPLDAHTQFWIADRQLFTALHLQSRMVVLTPEELDLAEEKLGRVFVRSIEIFVLDHAKRRGFAIWTSQVMGETYRLELVDSQWQVTRVDSWTF
jgi:hypothetical protein